jgi:hypothetical protein
LFRQDVCVAIDEVFRHLTGFAVHFFGWCNTTPFAKLLCFENGFFHGFAL